MAFPPDRSLSPLDPLDASPVLDLGPETDDERGAPPELFAGRYEVLRKLGVGGMGIVELAYDRRACRDVALKRIRRSFPSCQERFRREYRALAAIKDRGVPAIYDIGETANGEPFFTMEIIRGETLRSHLRRERMAPLRALAVAIDLGRVLMAVHEVGVIHRDVKPDNVILETGDRVRLIDFGAALLTEDYYSQPHLRDATDVGKRWRTREAEFIGAAAYMCPLWYNEGMVSPQTDVFSVCVLLYEMIAGRALFSEETYRHREIRAEEFAPELAPLVAELQRGVSMVMFERHRTMADLVRALEIVRSDLLARATQPVPRRWIGAVAAASAASFVLGGAVALAVVFAAPQAPGLSAAASPAVAGSSRSEMPPLTAASADAVPVAAAPLDATAALHADPTAGPGATAPLAATTALPREEAPAVSPTVTPPATASPTTPRSRGSVASWDARLRSAEGHARRCLVKMGATIKPRSVTLAAGEPPSIHGVASDSAVAQCIRDALKRFDLKVAEGERQYTFFADP